MFTGLIKETGTIRSLAPVGGVTRIELTAPVCAPLLAIGDSLAVNGICLTVTRLRGDIVTVEAAAETRRVTTLPRWRRGDRVHLEPALRAGEPLGGHYVLGHVDGVGVVAGRRRAGGSLLLTVTLSADLARYLLPKGSVAVDGVSLTVDAGPFPGRFTVNLIPHTLAVTRLGALRPGARVNLEMDVMVKAARGEQPAAAAGHQAGPGSAGQEPEPLSLARLLARGFRRGSQNAR